MYVFLRERYRQADRPTVLPQELLRENPSPSLSRLLQLHYLHSLAPFPVFKASSTAFCFHPHIAFCSFTSICLSHKDTCDYIIGQPGCAKSLQSHLTLCDPMNCSLSGSPVRGILQARILKWVSISSSRESSQDGRESNPHLLCLSELID